MLVLGSPKVQYFDTGTQEFLAGGLVYSYIAGGSTTPKATYATVADALAFTNPNSNPVVLNGRGEAAIVLNGATRIVLTDSLGNQLYSFDNLDQSSTDILDSNGNALLRFVSVPNATNYYTITNGATGSNPIFAASGGDVNVDADVRGKGTGTVKINNAYKLPLSDGTSGQFLTTNGAGVWGYGTVPGRFLNVQTFTASGTYTPTAGATTAIVYGTGGGGGGGTGSSGAGAGGGGAGGGTCIHRLTSLTTSYAVVIGALGTGSVSSAGGSGGATTFGSGPLFTANGGAGGNQNSATNVIGGSLGGTATGGNILNLSGGPGGAGLYLGANITVSGCGGASMWGGGGQSTINAQGGIVGVTYGSGGSGGAPQSGTSRDGASGAAGVVVVYEYL